jgi:hypothetical protein
MELNHPFGHVEAAPGLPVGEVLQEQVRLFLLLFLLAPGS